MATQITGIVDFLPAQHSSDLVGVAE